MKKQPWLTLALAIHAAGLMARAELGRTDEHDYEPPQPGTYTLPVIKHAAGGEVLDTIGHPLELATLTTGRVTVLSFIYTRCASAKACPFATGVLRQLHQLSAEDEQLAREMRLVSMSFDPRVDTPERMKGYANLSANRTNAAPWHFVTTRSQIELLPILEAYGQAVDRKKNPADPTGPLNHTLRVFLIDAAGNIRNIYSSGTLDLRLVRADIRTLAGEQSRTIISPQASRPQPGTKPDA